MLGLRRSKWIVGASAAFLALAAVVHAWGGLMPPPGGRSPGPFAAVGRVPPILRLALRAARTLRYTGTRVIEFRTSDRPKRHVEYILKDGPRSRVWFPESSPYSGQIIIEKGGTRYHYMPNTGEIQKSSARGGDAYVRLVQAIREGRYVARVREDGAVAGIHTRAVSIEEPGGAVVQRLWIQPGTGMVLKRVLYDASGAGVGFFEFQSLEFNPTIKSGDFAFGAANVKYVQLRDKIADAARRTGLMPFSVPANRGYDLRTVHVLRPRSPHPILVQTYHGTQGFVSLFQTTGPINARLLEKVAAGRYQTYTWRQNGSNFALVGDPEVAELHRIASLVGAGG